MSELPQKLRDIMSKHDIIFANQLPKIEFITTGFSELDQIVQFPRKRITEIYGLQAVGKTSLVLSSIAGMTQAGLKVLFIDVENTFNQERAEELGVDPKKLAVSNEAVLEEVADLVEENLPKFDAIVVDSVAAMIPRAEAEGHYGDALIGLKARLMGQFMRRIVAKLHKTNCSLIFINQLRENIEMFSAKYSTPGGLALKYAASLRIELKTTSKDRIIKNSKQTGHWVHAIVTKSKVGKPHQRAKFKITY